MTLGVSKFDPRGANPGSSDETKQAQELGRKPIIEVCKLNRIGSDLADHESLDVEDLVGGSRFTWTGKVQHLRLDPGRPYAIWRVTPPGGEA